MSVRRTLIAQLGDVMQIAFVPRDFDAALRFWTQTIGVGPFFLREHVSLQDVRYRGEPSNVDFGVAIGYWGDIQVELVKQHNDGPSIYKEFLDEGREGLHHVCILVDDMGCARDVCRGIGAEILQEGRLAGGEVIYVDSGGGPGAIVEILEISEDGRQGFAMMREAARTWDGLDPVRLRR